MERAKKIDEFFHYSKNITEIKKKGYIDNISFAKTNTYDFILDQCPEIILDKTQIKKLELYKKKNKLNIKKENNSYESKYRDLKLKHKDSLLDEFFDKNKFILAFDEKIPEGWKKAGMFQLLINKIGANFLKFRISKKVAKSSFVLEQKYWGPKYSEDKFEVNIWNPSFEIEKHPEIIKEVFGKYYKSIKRISEYKKGDFEVPEFWISEKVLFSACKTGKISKNIFKKMLKEKDRLKIQKPVSKNKLPHKEK
jgi:hypothetical protein